MVAPNDKPNITPELEVLRQAAYSTMGRLQRIPISVYQKISARLQEIGPAAFFCHLGLCEDEDVDVALIRHVVTDLLLYGIARASTLSLTVKPGDSGNL